MAIRSSQRRENKRSPADQLRPVRTARASEPATAIDPARIDSGPLDQYLGYYLRRLYDDYRKHFVAQERDLDLQPREVAAMFVIGLNPGLTPSHLSGALALDGAQITAMLNMFENRGLLERRVSNTDARSRLVHLTAAGETLLERLKGVVAGFDRNFSRNSLTDAELEQLIALLAKLYAGLGSA